MEDKRVSCTKCGTHIEHGERVHQIEFGQWSVRSNGFMRSSSDLFCRECWSDMKPRAKGIEYEVDSVDTLIDILESSRGSLVADLGSQVIGSRPFFRIYNGDGQVGVVSRRFIGNNSVGLKTKIEDRNKQEVEEKIRDIIHGSELPDVVRIISEENSPFDEYPNIEEDQQKLTK